MKLMVDKLSFGYRCWNVLRGVSFEACDGNVVCILGKNGSGKSTLIRCILGLLHYTQGRIEVDGADTKNLSARELARLVSYIPQNQPITFAFSALNVVLMGTTTQLHAFSCPGKKQYAQALHAMEMLGISDLAERSFLHLSGGERQLVLIARAIAQQAKILLMDEPCTSLDYGNQIRVLEKIKTLSRQGYLVVMSTHSPDQAFMFADQVLVLMDGKVERFGPPDTSLDDDIIERIYGINVKVFSVGSENTRICLPQITGKGV